ncbi:MAG: AmmeMemoRadiSam system protein B [Chloroflexales bacterium]|nr:AmmeMemoRadiSam system protein B [Chloroflexales bacterium]
MDIRRSSIASVWYPAAPVRLRRRLDQYLADAHIQVPEGAILGIVAPHAGLRYSGAVAAWAFACLRGLQVDLVAILGPMHRDAPAPLLTTAYDAYETPLGSVVVDHNAVRQLDQGLRTRLGYSLTPLRRDNEHSLEIELPFLQHTLGSFRLLPVMIRDQDATEMEALGHALAETVRGQRALLVASSDLSHFYPQPIANKLDSEILRRIEAFDAAGVLAAIKEGIAYACGGAAIAAVLSATHDLGANRVRIVRYGTSGDVNGDYHSVVGYGAAVIWQAQEP